MVLIYIWCFIPHIFLWGFCFWFCIPSASSSSCSARALSHTHNFVTTLSHAHTRNIFHTQLCHTPSLAHNFVSHSLVTHSLSHTHTDTHNFVTHTQLCHTELCHTELCHTELCHTHTHNLSHTVMHNFVTDNLGHIRLRFAWQAWHLVTSTFVLRGRPGTSRHRPSFCVAGLALTALGWLWWRVWAPLGHRWSPVTLRHFAWQAWRLVTPTFVLRGRHGAWRHQPSFCVAGVALIALGLAGSGGALGPGWSPVTPQHFAWQVWHLVTSTFLCVAGVALGDINLRFCGAGVGLGNIDVAFAWQGGTCGTLSHTQLCHAQLCLSFGVAGVASALTLSHTHTHTQLFHSHKLQHAVLSHANFSHTHTSLSRTNLSTHTHTLPHTTLPHTTFYTQFFHTQRFTQNSFTHTTLSHIAFHTTCLPPSPISFPIPFSHLFWACWKKLTCGVIRSFNYGQNPLVIQRSELETHHI